MAIDPEKTGIADGRTIGSDIYSGMAIDPEKTGALDGRTIGSGVFSGAWQLIQ